MKRYSLLVMGLVTAALIAGIVQFNDLQTHKQGGGTGMKITSSAFNNNGAIESKYSCQGEGVNPPLSFGDVPEGAKSLAMIVDDPDAPAGTFVHWVVWNISTTMHQVPENWTPDAGSMVGANGAGIAKWYPPCPPSGTHHYHFKLYAVSAELKLDAGSSKSELEQAMNGHIVSQAELVGTYTKQ